MSSPDLESLKESKGSPLKLVGGCWFRAGLDPKEAASVCVETRRPAGLKTSCNTPLPAVNANRRSSSFDLSHTKPQNCCSSNTPHLGWCRPSVLLPRRFPSWSWNAPGLVDSAFLPRSRPDKEVYSIPLTRTRNSRRASASTGALLA